MRKFLKNLMSDQQGATAIEYSLIAGIIIISCVTAIRCTGTQFGLNFIAARIMMAMSLNYLHSH